MLYDVTVQVVAASGYQIFRVEAGSEEEARQIFASGQIVESEVEVTGLDLDNAEVAPAGELEAPNA